MVFGKGLVGWRKSAISFVLAQRLVTLRHLSAGMTGQGSIAAVKAEVPIAVEVAGAPGQSLVSRLAGSTPGALGSSAAAAEKVLKRKADLISSPSLPSHLQPALQCKTSSCEVRCSRIIAVAPTVRGTCSSLALVASATPSLYSRC